MQPVNTVSLDEETELPLGLLEPCPFNPKKSIHGVFRAGLSGSLDHFGCRDRLKVCPTGLIVSLKHLKGRYMVLNGNQRLDVLRGDVEARLIAEKFGLGDARPSEIQAVRDEPKNAKVLRKIADAVLRTPVPVQVITKLREGVDFDENEAKFFVATWDRNRSIYDEARQGLLARVLGESGRDRSLLDRLARPEKVFVLPPSEVPGANGEPAAPSFLSPGSPGSPPPPVDLPAPGEFTPTEAEPWGSPPPPSAATPPPPALKTLMLSLTPEGYKEITESVLRVKSRVFRERKLALALAKLEKISDVAVDKVDDIVLELALRIVNVHIEAAEAEAENGS